MSAVYPNWTRHFGKCRLAFQRRVVQWKRIAGGQTDGGALRPSSSGSRSRAVQRGELTIAELSRELAVSHSLVRQWKILLEQRRRGGGRRQRGGGAGE